MRESTRTEASVLGSVLMHGGSWWEKVLDTGGDYTTLFYDTNHQMVASVFDSLYRDTGEFSIPTVTDTLRRTTNLGSERIDKVVQDLQHNASLTTPERLESAVTELSSSRSSRELSAVVSKAEKGISEGLSPAEVQVILEEAGGVSLPTAHVPTMFELVDELESEEAPAWAVPTGLRELDRCLDGGWESGKSYVVAAASKVGKTTFMFSAIERALTAGAVVVVFSLETIKSDFYNKMMANISGLDRNTVIKPFNSERDVEKKGAMLDNMLPDDRDALLQARAFLRQSKLYPLFESDVSGFESIPAVVRQVQRDNPGEPVVAFLDHLGLLVDNTSKKDERTQLQHFTKSIARMCRNQEVAMVELVQIRRIEEGQEPQPGHLRGSGSIEQDANSVILLHRKRTADVSVDEGGNLTEGGGDGMDPNVIQIHLALNRSGPTVKFKADFFGAIDLIEDMEEGSDQTQAML